MLVLARKEGERVFLGENIALKVVSASPSKVQVLIHAPWRYRIIRSELMEQKLRERKERSPDEMTYLVFTRKPGQGFFILPSIQVIVRRGGDGIARLAIEAPPEVHIIREELAVPASA